MAPLENAALILQGGSFRCMFTAGALDVLMEHGLWFSYVNGVSDDLFSRGLCLPAGPWVSDDDLQYISRHIHQAILK